MRIRQKGSVVLIALSCVTVLGLALAGFLALGNQAMKLSNRSYAKMVSKNLAEMGLERALRSYNANTFSSWTLSGTTATKTLTITSSHYGNSGITASANVRVDHYLDTRRATIWNAMTTYAANDYVWYQGVWYLCTTAPTSNQAPSNTTYWKAAPDVWNPYASYQIGNIALSGGSAYRCIVANANQAPPNATYWTAYSVAAWSSATTYAVDTVAYRGGMPYRCILANTNQVPPNSTYWLSAPVIYSEGVAVLPDGYSTTIKTQLRATLAPAPLFPNALAATAVVTLGTGVVDSYNSMTGAYGGSNIGSSAVLAGGNTGGTAVAITDVRVNGYLAAPSAATSPYGPQYSNSTSGIVTSTAAPTVPATKIDPTRISRSPNIPQFDIQTVSGAINLPSPSSGSSLAYQSTTNLGTAGAVTVYNVSASWANASNTSYYSGLYLNSASDIINITGRVILNVTGSYFGMGNGKITINTGSSLEVYFSTSTQMYFGTFGSGGIDNKTLDPSKLFIASNSATNTLNYHYLQSTVLPFYGTIYMPNAYLTVASNNIAIYGALSAKNINFTSVANFHYDTALRNAGSVGTFIDSPYRISEWRELTDATEHVVLP
jgi:hypothetical protein